MATEQITDDELLVLHALANARGGVKLGSSVLLRLLNTVDALRALRSGEAGKDAIYSGEHAAAEIPAILAAHPGYTLPSSHDF